MADAQVFGFNVDWYDAQADLIRHYQLTLYVPQRGPTEASMYDPKTKRAFLKRMPIPELRLEDMYIGSTVTIHGRQLKVKDYSDDNTRSALESSRDSCVLLTSPDAYSQLGKIISCIERLGLSINRMRLVNESGPVAAVQITGVEAGDKLDFALNEIPRGFARQVSLDEGRPYFEDRSRYPATLAGDHCTLGIIRPHTMKAGHAGEVISSIMEAGFEISAVQSVHLERAQAMELLEVYQNVLPYYSEMVAGMCEAPCIAMELRKDGDVVEDFRRLCGPYDVDMARHLRPNCLRAKYGVDNANNGVHATDLAQDAEREVRYVFEVLA